MQLISYIPRAAGTKKQAKAALPAAAIASEAAGDMQERAEEALCGLVGEERAHAVALPFRLTDVIFLSHAIDAISRATVE